MCLAEDFWEVFFGMHVGQAILTCEPLGVIHSLTTDVTIVGKKEHDIPNHSFSVSAIIYPKNTIMIK